jgi:hypothetical protein
MKDLDDLMMESFIEVVNDLRRASGLKHVDFVAKVWPESPQRSAIVRWHNMRGKVSNTGKPQGVLITDAQRMAQALNTDIAYLFLQASQAAKTKAAEAAAPKKAKAAARPKPDGETGKPAKSKPATLRAAKKM